MNKYQHSIHHNPTTNPNKASFISLNQNNSQKSQQTLPKYSSQVFDTVLSNNRSNPLKKLSMKFGKGNCDEESTRQFTKYEDHLSKDNHAVNFQQIMNQPKIGRESENIHFGYQLKSSINGNGEKKIANSKSTSFLPPKANSQTMQIEKLNMISAKQQDNDEIKNLQMKIKQLEIQNQRIKQENIQLRMIKLSTNSDTFQMLSLRLEMQQLRKKIQKFKLEEKFFESSSQVKIKNKIEAKPKRKNECHTDNKERASQLDRRTQQNYPKQIFLSSFFQKPNEFCQPILLPRNCQHQSKKSYHGIHMNSITKANITGSLKNQEMQQSPYFHKK